MIYLFDMNNLGVTALRKGMNQIWTLLERWLMFVNFSDGDVPMTNSNQGIIFLEYGMRLGMNNSSIWEIKNEENISEERRRRPRCNYLQTLKRKQRNGVRIRRHRHTE